MSKVKKAVIPAAGLGTRFLPATKALPKEMLPIIDTPTIQYIVEEAVKAGIEDIIIVTGKQKRAIEDHFDRNVELEVELENKGKLVFYAGMDKVKFKKQVVPGDQLVMTAKFVKRRGTIAVVEAKAEVDGKLAASGTLTFALGQ